MANVKGFAIKRILSQENGYEQSHELLQNTIDQIMLSYKVRNTMNTSVFKYTLRTHVYHLIGGCLCSRSGIF